MAIVSITPAASDPVTLDLAKLNSRIDWSNEDEYITLLISSATRFCEEHSFCHFITQTYEWTIDCWPHLKSGVGYFVPFYGVEGSTIYARTKDENALHLPYGPIQSITYVKYMDTSGTLQTWDSAKYVPPVLGDVNPRLGIVQNQPWPTVADQINAITIRAVSGFGDDATAVPAQAKQAILKVVDYLYNNRGMVGAAGEEVIGAAGVASLLDTISCGKRYSF